MSFQPSQDGFLHVVKITFLEKYSVMKGLLEGMLENPEVPEERIKAA